MGSTYCPHLWNGLFVYNNGDVFNCCLSKPGRIGNIHHATLREIAAMPSVQSFRRSSLSGELGCYEACSFVKKFIPKEKRPTTTEVEYSELRKLDLKFGERCNIACVMCHQAARVPPSTSVLDPEVLIQNIDTEPFHDIILQGGETLFIPECLEYMDHLENLGKRYTILTNGLLIDDDMACRLAENANRVIISINAATKTTHELVNAGSRFDRVLENIERLRRARERGRSELKIIGRMTITVHSVHEIPLFIERFGSFGFDYVNFGYDKATVPQMLTTNPDLAQRVREGVKRALLSTDLEMVDTLRLIYLGLAEEEMLLSSFFNSFHEMIGGVTAR